MSDAKKLDGGEEKPRLVNRQSFKGVMRPSTSVTLLSLSLLVPAAECSLLAKSGATLNGKPIATSSGGSKAESPTQSTSAPAPTEGAAPKTAGASTFKAPAPPAANVADSVPAIPDSMKVTAAAGAPVISLQGASWCEGVKGIDWGNGKVERVFPKHVKKAGELYSSGLESMSEMARFACGGKQSADRMSWVRNYMQANANVSGLSEQHQVHLMGVLANLQSFDLRDFVNGPPKGCETFKPKGNPNALESNLSQARRIGMGCADGTNADWMLWWMDRGESIPSQVETLGFLYSSFAYSARVVSFKTGATALIDANRFDEKAFFSELQALGADEQVVAKSIIQYAKTTKKLKAWKAHHAEALGEDYELLAKAAQAGFDDWVSAYTKEKAAVDFAFQMEEAVLEGDSRKFAGCSEKARKFATEFVMRGGPTTPDEIRSAAAHPIGSLLVAAAYECEKGLGNPLVASVYAQMGKSAPVSRGPRFAARLALVKAVAEIKAVKSRFTLEARDFMPPANRNGFGHTSTGYFSTGEGVVASAKKQGDTLAITFKKESWKQPVYKCKQTNRLDRIEADGTLVYRKNCKQTGTKTVTSQEKPVTIPAAAATGVKSGAFLVVARSKKNSSEGLPRHVYSGKDRKKLLNFYGLAL